MRGVTSHRGLWLGLALSAILHVSAGFVATSFPIEAFGGTPQTRLGQTDGVMIALEQPNPDQGTLPTDPTSAAILEELMRADPLAEQPTPLTPPPLPTPEHKLTLGIDKSDQKTENWMGFPDPTQHQAMLSTVEQPQLDPNPGAPGALGIASAADHATGPTTPEVIPSPAGSQTPIPPAALAQPLNPQTKQPDQSPREGDDAATGEKRIEPPRGTPGDMHQDPTLPGPSTVPPGSRSNQNAPDRIHKDPLPPEIPRKVDPVMPTPQPEQAQPLAAAPMGPPAPTTPTALVQPATKSESPSAGTPGGDHAGAGIKSEKEADASSTTATLEIRPGRPAAAQGLDITTKRPIFTRLTRVTAYPENPLLKITFNRSGVVTKVQMLESSGNVDVDGPVMNAVYQWTARGKQLSELIPGESNSGLTITVRILLR